MCNTNRIGTNFQVLVNDCILLKMIRGLGDYKKANDDDKKKKTTSYVGGEKSGMAVENPADDDLEAIVAKAKAGGQQHATEGKGGAPKTELKITLYSNGFIVDDGPFRPYTAPEN